MVKYEPRIYFFYFVLCILNKSLYMLSILSCSICISAKEFNPGFVLVVEETEITIA